MDTKQNIERIKKLASELNLTVKCNQNTKGVFISNNVPGRKRIRRVINVTVENIESAMYWVAGQKA